MRISADITDSKPDVTGPQTDFEGRDVKDRDHVKVVVHEVFINEREVRERVSERASERESFLGTIFRNRVSRA